MSLYGALFSGVSGIRGQSNRIGILSDNIANVNTVGYKGASGLFKSLVTNAATTSTYSPGGVLGGSRQLVSKQGLIQSTDSPTDIAISGSGFFVVNSQSDGAGQIQYSRSGSFRQDSTGNFRNTSGFYLQAWPLDREGRLPGAPGNTNTISSANLGSLQVVNVQSLTGAAAATTTVKVGANLNAGQNIFPGASGSISMDALNARNFGISAKSIIAPGGVNNLTRGDKLNITTGTNTYTYRYGGFSSSRDVTSGGSVGDSELGLLANTTTLGTNPYAFVAGDNTVVISQTAHGLVDGQVINLSGLGASVNGISTTELNSRFIVDVIDANTYSIETTTAPASQLLSTSNPVTTLGGGSNQVDIAIPSHSYVAGQSITLSGLTGPVGDIAASALNTTFTIVSVTANSIRVTTSTADTGAADNGGGAVGRIFANNGGGASIVSQTRLFSGGNILDATSSGSRFLGTTGTSIFAASALSFTITSTTSGLKTFTYTSTSPDTKQQQFNTLDNLAVAINEVEGLSARVVNNRLYVGATNANESVVFANKQKLGTAGPPVLAGIDWVRELGLADIEAGTDRFSSLKGLSTLATASSGISSAIENEFGASILKINVDDPLDTITFSDLPNPTSTLPALPASSITTVNGSRTLLFTFPTTHNLEDQDIVTISGVAAGTYNGIADTDLNGQRFPINRISATQFEITLPLSITAATASGVTGPAGVLVEPPRNLGSLVAELGLVDSLNSVAYSVAGPQSTIAYGPAYSPLDSATNLASGAITAQFSRQVRIFDAQGSGHDMTFAFLKTGVNQWAVELYAVPASDVSTTLPNGLVTYGNVQFNGDGSLRFADTRLTDALNITWTNGALPSTVNLDLGTAGQPFGTAGATVIGDTKGLSQFNAAYKVNFIDQNGAPVGELTGVTITSDGIVVASYNNGETQSLFKIPLADFANPDELQTQSGNTFTQSSESGEVNLREAGTSGVGTVAASSLEASNVELANELTDMIVAQRAYQANTKVITTADSLLDELNRILQ